MSQRDILDITHQRLSTITVAPFQVCRHCRIVDLDDRRLCGGYVCPVCKVPGDCGMMYFEMSIHTLVNLMQEAFHMQSKPQDEWFESQIETNSHNISVVLFFCTLREILINNLITELCSAQDINTAIYKRLLSDNSTYTQKQDNLLPSLTGKKWKTLIKEADAHDELDYIELNDFLIKAVKARNRFMHEGKKWDIDRALAEGCMSHIMPLLSFYVSLHNKYVHPDVLKRLRNS